MKQQNVLPVVLTIAGSDPSGGAGIQADLKTFTALGVYGMSVITAVTSQNTQKVNSVYPLPAKVVKEQLETVLSDIKPDVVKIGMLANDEIITVVADTIKKYKLKNVILDPVMFAKDGTCLSTTSIQTLIPQTLLITPNIDEAEIFTGIKINNLRSAKRAAEKLVKMGAKNVLIKGGHLKGDMCKDFLFVKNKCITLSYSRIHTKNTHGTGCTYSSAIACFINDSPLQIAVKNARDYLQMAIKNSLPIGKGNGPLNHIVLIQMQKEMKKAIEKLNDSRISNLIPEVQSNLAYALENADSLNEVLGFPGRIIRLNEEIKTLAEPALGASTHMGKVVLAAMRHDPSCRAAMNIKFSDEIINICKKINLTTSEFDRDKEPPATKNAEGQSLEWGTDAAIKKLKMVPDIIFDRGAIRKEAMIRVLGKNPDDAAKKIIKIVGERK